jgi:hypothetical protein
MPASPDDGARLAAGIVDAIHQLEVRLLTMLAAGIRGDDPAGVDWLNRQLAQLQLIQTRIARDVQQATPELLEQVQQVVLDAYNRGQALAIDDVTATGARFASAATPVQAARGFADDASRTVRAALDRLPALLGQVYRQAVQAAVAPVLAGDVTRRDASQQVLNDLSRRGVTGFRDVSGRNWSLETYAEMAVRTAAGQAAVQGHVDAVAASGLDLLIVSDAPRECPLCRPWERRVLSISGRVGAVIEPNPLTGRAVTVRVAGSLAEARAAGLQHPNCRHTVSVYTPGVTPVGGRTADQSGYAAGQRLRLIERKIREWKRREALALTPEAASAARTRVRQWQAEAEAHTAAHGLRRLPYREQIGRAH